MKHEDEIYDPSLILAPVKTNSVWDYLQVVGMVLVLIFIFFPWLCAIVHIIVWFFTNIPLLVYTEGKVIFSVLWPFFWLWVGSLFV